MSDIAIGTIVGGYQILEVVGQGGMATVYRAHQLSMKRDVAMKMLPRQFLSQSNSLDRFKREANIVARLEHRAIVPVHDYGEHDGVPYLVMRYMDGGSVDELIYRGPVSPERTLDILLQIAPALDYAHQNAVLHRDLKPSNILMDANGDAYLTDFGIARLLGEESSPSLTTTGVVGTPSYMSPEQAQGHDLDGRSDIYALGVVLFEMLAGSRPFEGETPYSVAVKHVTEAPPSACAKNTRLPDAVDSVLYKVLAKNREQRYQSAAEVAAALRAAITPEAVPVQTPTEHPLETVSETEPSLEQTLREEHERRRADTSQGISSEPVPPVEPPPSSNEVASVSPPIQLLPPYAGTPSSGAYLRSLRQFPVRRRSRTRTVAGQPRWLVWTVVGLLLAGILTALGIAGVYYLMNDSTSNVASSDDLPQTALFKLTATKRAILDDIATRTLPPTTTSVIVETPLPTIPPTNTLDATRTLLPTSSVTPTPQPTAPPTATPSAEVSADDAAEAPEINVLPLRNTEDATR